MMEHLSTYRMIIAATIILLYAPATEAAQTPTASPAQNLSVSVSEDSVAWRRDPFIGTVIKGSGPAVAKGIPLKSGESVSKSDQDFHLQGIMLVDNTFHALINGRSVKTGDTIGGFTIKSIKRHQVAVRNDRNEIITYDIYQGRIDRGKQ
jgi:hypothetical protein